VELSQQQHGIVRIDGVAVENWLSDLDIAIKQTLREYAHDAWETLQKRSSSGTSTASTASITVMDTASRIAWLTSYPAQSIVLAEQSQCCAAITKVLESGTAATALSQLHDSVEAQIDSLTRILQANSDSTVITADTTTDTVAASDTTTAEGSGSTVISDSLRITVGALITVWCHARDVIASLATAKVNCANDFEWQKQLRYTWVTPTSSATTTATVPAMGYGNMLSMLPNMSSSSPTECKIYQNDAHFVHDHEYIGNTARLVMTPLTDACYLAITSALKASASVVIGGRTGCGKHHIIQVNTHNVYHNVSCLFLTYELTICNAIKCYAHVRHIVLT
jgi:Hydrolytic ATP binding site of dynein motor region